MEQRNFRGLLEAKWAEGKFLCVGLDPLMEKLPEEFQPQGTRHLPLITPGTQFKKFCQDRVRKTAHVAAAYKLNIAFFEAEGIEGIGALGEIIRFIHECVPETPAILDAKRGDIGDSNKAYAKAIFAANDADAVTVHPYFGEEALRPFLDREDKGIIVLCRTTNPGAREFQDLHTLTLDPRAKPDEVSADEWLKVLCDDSMQLYERVAFNVATKWKHSGNCLLVVGATYPVEAKKVRARVGDVPFLIPGIGKQQGDLEATVMVSQDGRGFGMLINLSSGIIYADDPRSEAEKYHNLINRYRSVSV
ncbi:MAG: orotidine 5'-phosphate decarboxylase [Candidatus Ryanbacteria bacterium RIFCSPHIGHO2_12_FULL_47_12b]|uniref:Orotidine-5'-phosphate decarboxylase n=1 Tax=Candidatus Ryanbacteria bacterium RIFCSPLOWO2_12_FULL_47_9c TaxID=1802131 RepID=A0A1G2H5K6_9BACT|nr:MAG: Orotidine 5'-phosphate decarboxylase [Parcubacteria group bacterium GW2011_GWA2_47_10b]OGZ53311.1 MAG: orotidine 5'-phosphate decarboxylase [Candidatus Ryanbacteria bacterium RIFCSPHIGHO2_12_FULL_47_12b]OGZ57764.1 MAG: orotidine 5'-phosphate decarboxylase [Candidatus Ryanbacteria bacterium RIFCSPLOWO2_12_FULL_47_9c]